MDANKNEQLDCLPDNYEYIRIFIEDTNKLKDDDDGDTFFEVIFLIIIIK